MKIEAQVIHEDICGTCPDFKPVRYSEYLKNDVIKCKHYELCRRIFGYTMSIIKDTCVKKDEAKTPDVVHCKERGERREPKRIPTISTVEKYGIRGVQVKTKVNYEEE